jgi:hypothetical protein
MALLLSAPSHAEVPPGKMVLGINEGVSIPKSLRTAENRARMAELLADDATHVRAVGATAVRGHTGNFPAISQQMVRKNPKVMDDADAWVRALQHAQVDGILMLSPWPGNATANSTERYAVADLDDYRRYVAEIVERYDGDGTADMPGLTRPIKLWEIDNEPDLKNHWPPKDNPSFDPKNFCKPADYAAVLVETSKAIRAADPTARVLNGGIYGGATEHGQAYMRELFSLPGTQEAIDIVSIHVYAANDGDSVARAVRDARTLVPGKPVWLTETSMKAEPDEDTQARRVVATIARAGAAGAERVYWHSLADPPAGSRPAAGPFGTNSLYRASEKLGPLALKPAGAVFSRVAALLVQETFAGATDDGKGVVTVASGAKFVYLGGVLAPGGGTNLLDGSAISPGGTAQAPAFVKASPSPGP